MSPALSFLFDVAEFRFKNKKGHNVPSALATELLLPGRLTDLTVLFAKRFFTLSVPAQSEVQVVDLLQIRRR